MALSDLILRLGNQAKDLEDSAAALHTDNDAKAKARASELHESLAKVRLALGQKLDADSGVAADRLTELQRTISEGFEALRADAAARTADPAVQADSAASQAELDAEDALDFAIHALQEAEYYLLAAAAARADAGDLAEAELDDDIDDEIDVTEVTATDGNILVDEVVATDGEAAVDDIVVTDGETALEDTVVTDGDTAAETIDTVDIGDPATTDEALTK